MSPPHDHPARRDPGALTRTLVLPYIGAVIIAALWVRFAELPSLFRSRPLPWGLVWCGAGAAFAITVVLAGRLLEGQVWYRAMGAEIKALLTQALGLRVRASDAALIAIYSSIGEEALFRGALQPWVGGALASLLDRPEAAPVLGVLVAGLAFGLVHAPVKPALRPWTVLAIVMGFAFGALTEAADSLLPAIIAHGLINFLNLLRLGQLDFHQRPGEA